MRLTHKGVPLPCDSKPVLMVLGGVGELVVFNLDETLIGPVPDGQVCDGFELLDRETGHVLRRGNLDTPVTISGGQGWLRFGPGELTITIHDEGRLQLVGDGHRYPAKA